MTPVNVRSKFNSLNNLLLKVELPTAPIRLLTTRVLELPATLTFPFNWNFTPLTLISGK